jgi:uncharacterized BrkB/YihY/UPF0761 family membrane protein
MIKNYLSSIQDVGFYGVLAIIIFFTVFVFVIAYVTFMRKELVNQLGEAPLHDGTKREINSVHPKSPM